MAAIQSLLHPEKYETLLDKNIDLTEDIDNITLLLNKEKNILTLALFKDCHWSGEIRLFLNENRLEDEWGSVNVTI